jgi:hypothetical protein
MDFQMDEAKEVPVEFAASPTPEEMVKAAKGSHKKLPKSWGSIPATARFEAEVDWVYANYTLIVEERASGKNRLYLNRALSPAPSRAAIGLAEWAKDNRKAVYEQMVIKTKKGFEGGDEEKVRAEKKSIEEIRSILTRMIEVKKKK